MHMNRFCSMSVALVTCLIAAGALAGSANMIPYSESFEAIAPHTAISTVNGWTVSVPPNGAAVETTPDHGLTSPYFPAEGHTKALFVTNGVITNTLTQVGNITTNYVDMLVRMSRTSAGIAVGTRVAATNVSSDAVVFRLDSAGHPVFRHSHWSWTVADYIKVWTTNTSVTIPDLTWFRLSLTFCMGGDGEVYFQVRINDGAPLVDEAGYSKTFGNDEPDEGSWFMEANQDYLMMGLSTPDRIGQVTMRPGVAVDDLYVGNESSGVPVGGGQNTIPYSESFEAIPAQAFISTVNGWHDSIPGGAAVVSVPDHGLTSPYFPGAPHTKVLSVTNSTAWNELNQTNDMPAACVDMLVRMSRESEGIVIGSLDPLVSPPTFAFRLDSAGHPVFRHSYYTPEAGDYVQVWTTNTSVTIPEMTWFRLSITFEFKDIHDWFDVYCQVRINDGAPLSDETGYSKSFDNMAPDGGAWFMSANLPLSYVGRIDQLAFFQGVTVDDLYVGDGSEIVVPRPAIGIEGNGIAIANGDSTPSIPDGTDFGSAARDGGTVDRVFVVTNSGPGALYLTGVPLVRIVGAQTSDFRVVAQPAATMISTGGCTTTFTVRFDPTLAGGRTGTVSIASDDISASPYTFAVSGIGVSGVNGGQDGGVGACAIPYTNSFEAGKHTNMLGWYKAGGLASSMIVPLADHGLRSPYFPGEPHTKALRTYPAATNRLAPREGLSSVNIDMLVQCRRTNTTSIAVLCTEPMSADSPVPSSIEAYVNFDGHLVFRHSSYETSMGDYVRVWTTNTTVTIPDMGWYRLSIKIEFKDMLDWFDAYYSIAINGGAPLADATGYADTTDNLEADGGPWFMLANLPYAQRGSLAWVAFRHDMYIDDYAVMTREVSGDTDNDGVPDDWERDHFGDLDEDGNGDADSDGVCDRDEHRSGGNPHDEDSDHDGQNDRQEQLAGSSVDDPDSHFEVDDKDGVDVHNITNNIVDTVMTWPTLPGRVYRLYCTTNLSVWPPLPIYEVSGDGCDKCYTNRINDRNPRFIRMGVDAE